MPSITTTYSPLADIAKDTSTIIDLMSIPGWTWAWVWPRKRKAWTGKTFHLITPSHWLADCEKKIAPCYPSNPAE
ncbi:hypothetical protein METHB2_110060 [Candidatus Methylobacter favarea]|uniref:Uncharacterized protein n=1 Tax=Candidatus Methylobacter favarea TaxID=2707345 RepID=A0A8S0XHC0_9GAMM|nr:hypothetical protein [Candidatus Methylobacter favarea]CAA9889561.1 hypothetical protein METHB2_110060 [Candidatus Methylobacter favarea]